MREIQVIKIWRIRLHDAEDKLLTHCPHFSIWTNEHGLFSHGREDEFVSTKQQ